MRGRRSPSRDNDRNSEREPVESPEHTSILSHGPAGGKRTVMAWHTAKTSALCGEHSTDGVVLETISYIETLTTELSNKIWQKISLLPRL
jgi:hypothetical protein